MGDKIVGASLVETRHSPEEMPVEIPLEPDVSCSPRHEEVYYSRAVMTLSFGFLFVFVGFQAAQGLQTSLNRTLGNINLATLYATFTLLCLVAPPLVACFERLVGIRVMFMISALTYVAMVLSNVLDTPQDPAPVWAVPVAMNFLVGLGAPILWTAQNAFVCRCATKAALGHAETEQALEHWTGQYTTRYTSVFFTYFQFAGMVGNVLASGVLLGLSNNAEAKKWAKKALFILLGAISTLGAVLFLRLPPVADTGDSEKLPTLLDTARIAVTDARVTLFIPLLLVNGMTIAFFVGDFQTDVTCPVAGDQYTGFVIATYFGVNSLASRGWGKLITSGYITRRSAFVYATVFEIVYLAAKLFWEVPQNYISGSKDWTRLRDPTVVELVVVFALAATFACGDSFFQAGPPMVLQSYFSGSDEVVAALANIKLWQGLGQAIQFPIALLLQNRPQIRGGILLGLLVISIACLLILDCRARLDAQAVDASEEDRRR